MKKTVFYISFFLPLLISCNTSTQENRSLDKNKVISEVKSTEQNLFALLKQGKIDEAFSLHENSSNYRNISDGYTRTYQQMDSTLKANAQKGIKSYDYEFNRRDFMVLDQDHTLETLEGEKILKGNSDNTIERRAIVMSLLWSRVTNGWKLTYLHSSYKD